MYLLPYHVRPRRPIPIPPNIAARSTTATQSGAVPAKAPVAAVAVVVQAWLRTSTMRNIKIPVANALRKPFFFKLTFWITASGMPRRIVRPAKAPRNRT
jgi:hypothetical protein